MELAFWSLGRLFSTCFWGCRIYSRTILSTYQIVSTYQCVDGSHVPGFCKAREDKQAVDIINCALIRLSFWSFRFIHKAEEVLVHTLESWYLHPLHCLLHWIVRRWGCKNVVFGITTSTEPKRFLLKHDLSRINMIWTNPLVTHDL